MARVPAPLVSAHIEGQARLRRLVEQALAGIWADLPGYDRENVDEWLSRTLPVIAAAQRSSVALTEAFLAQFLERRPLGLNPADLTGAAARNGVDPAEVYQRPFVTLWSGLSKGTAFADASSAALARATATGAMDVQLAMRATADAVDQADESFFGYTRVADGGACAFCQEVDGAYVKAAGGFAMALHNHCGCGLEPNPEPHRGAVHLPDGTRVRDYQYGPLNDVVAVHEHGELGAVLTGATDHFTSESHL
jgi:hypothetical protein